VRISAKDWAALIGLIEDLISDRCAYNQTDFRQLLKFTLNGPDTRIEVARDLPNIKGFVTLTVE
jgi:hypothetical protein